MLNGKKIIAVIPARGGSKGIKGKNIKLLAGKPLISYVVTTAIESKCFDKIIVSTDSDEIAAVAEEFGAEVPYKRPKKYSTDTASSLDVFKHALDFFKKKGEDFDVAALLQPTSPLTKESDIQEAMQLFFKKKANAIVSVAPFEHSINIINKLPPDLSMDRFILKPKKVRRQDSNYYRINGAVYIVKVPYFMKNLDFYHNKSYAYIMPNERSIDVNSYFDMKICESIIKSDMV